VKVLFLSVKIQMSLKFKFRNGLNHLTSLNGFKLGHNSPDPPVGAFPLHCFLPMQRGNVRRPAPPCPGRCRRPTLSSRASRASPFPPPPFPSLFFPPLLRHSNCRKLHHTTFSSSHEPNHLGDLQTVPLHSLFSYCPP
jgi:hypothetical protein